MIPFIFLYGGGCTVVDNGNRDICRRRDGQVVIIHIIWLAVFVFLGGKLEEFD